MEQSVTRVQYDVHVLHVKLTLHYHLLEKVYIAILSYKNLANWIGADFSEKVQAFISRNDPRARRIVHVQDCQ